jgi:hypothetical protein
LKAVENSLGRVLDTRLGEFNKSLNNVEASQSDIVRHLIKIENHVKSLDSIGQRVFIINIVMQCIVSILPTIWY